MPKKKTPTVVVNTDNANLTSFYNDAFLVKGALATGIVKVHLLKKNNDGTITIQGISSNSTMVYKKGEYALTEQDAIDMAEEMKQIKIEKLKEQIEKLESLRFYPTWREA